ncbi:MAG TPA: hypothetical protein VGC41_03525, partial [Kofleriaceae bacterium]
MRAVLLLFVVACTSAPPPRPSGSGRVITPIHRDETRYYAIWLGGARVGTATETERWSTRGVSLLRTEVMSFLRGKAEVVMQTTIDIDADPQLVARRVGWTETTGDAIHNASATHDANGWQAPVVLDAAAIPAELVPLLVRRDGHFTGSVFMPARN